ncbi:MAG: glycosyltransferase [Candidatus Abyssobacteria bacterium SURF_5]|uniref:Glycosyltransferase n=1 Tax=Abyssobacteria bacterium (strain SURF_5) TaxID=2093360 RepID=A0A3A4N4Q8_ABYX5|nr:MAG: glycosyltransferase [Candidatus Abyssubacteria bacterium SURF_5]
MRIGFFYHSLVSDWNHGNAHFLRGIVTELQARGHEVRVFEPWKSWSRRNLILQHGRGPLREFHMMYPNLSSTICTLKTLEQQLDGLDLVLVHEWNDHKLVSQIGRHRKQQKSFKLLFHDTHHRSITDIKAMKKYELSHYDGVLAFGNKIRNIYLSKRWIRRAWTWHEAADTRVFRPLPAERKTGDLVWIGNWGDGERTAELQKFLLRPVKALGLRAHAYGVRYPRRAVRLLRGAGIRYKGWLPNYMVPRVFAQFKITAHIPRRPYVKALPGIPTIRPFEALACGIPLICSPWRDAEHLFTAGEDYLVAGSGPEMKAHIRRLLNEPEFAEALAQHGLKTVWERHTCIHRVDELLQICAELGMRSEILAPVSMNGKLNGRIIPIELISPQAAEAQPRRMMRIRSSQKPYPKTAKRRSRRRMHSPRRRVFPELLKGGS